jgi:hypothetical protein
LGRTASRGRSGRRRHRAHPVESVDRAVLGDAPGVGLRGQLAMLIVGRIGLAGNRRHLPRLEVPAAVGIACEVSVGIGDRDVG